LGIRYVRVCDRPPAESVGMVQPAYDDGTNGFEITDADVPF
jgi:hypothetical protein